MKFDSPLFDRIRVTPRGRSRDRSPGPDRRLRADRPVCDWPGCDGGATHRAPKGRLREGEYWRFCLDHVREYNHSYNYFAGMSDDAVARYQKDAVTGHRPTWKMGFNGTPSDGRRGASPFGHAAALDPFGMFGEMGGRPGGAGPERPERDGRMVRNAERKALHALGLEIDAKAPDIKARFKELVKRHHPDANGGDRSTEDRLVEVIQAYNYLKAAGFC